MGTRRRACPPPTAVPDGRRYSRPSRSSLCGWHDLDLRYATGLGAMVLRTANPAVRDRWLLRLVIGDLVGVVATVRHGGAAFRRSPLAPHSLRTVAGSSLEKGVRIPAGRGPQIGGVLPRPRRPDQCRDPGRNHARPEPGADQAAGAGGLELGRGAAAPGTRRPVQRPERRAGHRAERVPRTFRTVPASRHGDRAWRRRTACIPQ